MAPAPLDLDVYRLIISFMSVYNMMKAASLFKAFAGIVADLKRERAAKRIQALGRGIVARNANPEACFVALAHRVKQRAFESNAASRRVNVPTSAYIPLQKYGNSVMLKVYRNGGVYFFQILLGHLTNMTKLTSIEGVSTFLREFPWVHDMCQESIRCPGIVHYSVSVDDNGPIVVVKIDPGSPFGSSDEASDEEENSSVDSFGLPVDSSDEEEGV